MKTVLITGGAVRLGAALVEHFAHKGWRVLLTARHSTQQAQSLAARCGANVHAMTTSVSGQADAQAIAQWLDQHDSKLDLLVNNASTFQRLSVHNTTQADFQGLLESNLLGPYFLAQQCFGPLRAATGCIINIADAQVGSGVPDFSAYLAAKAALVSISKSMALEFAPHVRVNAVLPGTLHWPDSDALYDAEQRKAMERQIPAAKIGQWSDVVGAVDYLASAPFVTGVCLPVDGGRSAVF